MTVMEYNKLDNEDKDEILYENGSIIGDKEDGRYKIYLYKLYSFYVEIYYIIDEDLALYKMQAFLEKDNIKKYIETFHIPRRVTKEEFKNMSNNESAQLTAEGMVYALNNPFNHGRTI